ncbi:unnamed protein product [Peronospora farinosa]|uniref:Uncharacterized protein n=1 Tax=Peronospora farinosa TaxID=134698 RepID=A0ABN8C9C3_9STRA|nr:unnamed protein product [Peronospora farinosa]
MKQWKKNFGLAQRAMALRMDTSGIDTRQELAEGRKRGKDGLGWSRRRRKGGVRSLPYVVDRKIIHPNMVASSTQRRSEESGAASPEEDERSEELEREDEE